ncbi:DUF881 domain-containing protein, partial [Actinomadura sp. NPDC000929]|uniref:DUF881 domain-containing protein n=1 Tax=Actinomadura sp. NPDC000929 TaxID=3154517 RepID=UPI0033995803
GVQRLVEGVVDGGVLHRAARVHHQDVVGQLNQDLQVLVNGLWAAGARAIGVNGRRLTPTTAIRAAGEAILVDYRPLGGPYEVTAVGDPGRLRAAFAGSPADRRLAALRDRFGIRYGTRRSDEVRLPAAGAVRLRYAVPGEGGGR